MGRSMSRITWSTQKIIALILLLCSFVMLFLPWVNISINVMGQKFTIDKIIDYACMYEGTSRAEFDLELKEAFSDLSENMEYEGINMNSNRALSTFKAISGGISPVDAASASSFFGGLAGQLSDYIDENYYWFDSTELVVLSALSDSTGKIIAAAIFLWILVVVAIAGFLYGIYAVLTDGKKGLIPYLAVATVFFLIFVVLTANINNGIKSVSSTFSYLLSDAFSDIGINLSGANPKLFHITAAGIVCVLLADGAFLMTLFANGAGYTKSVTSPHHRTGAWHCPSCGQMMGAANSFCSICGAKRPGVPDAPPRCSYCGAVIKDGAAFCIKCGKPVRPAASADSVPPVRPETPADPVSPVSPNPKSDPWSPLDDDDL